jgi:hypothetical protein
MTTQPEALRLADLIDSGLKNAAHHEEAAAELRRLHALNVELLEALKALCESHSRFSGGVWDKARAAIAKAEGQHDRQDHQ